MQEESTIKFLSETLKFYAETANYVNDQIKKDGGYLAQFALEIVKKNEDTMSNLQQQFNDIHDKVDVQSPDEILKIIEELKKFQ